MAEKREQAEVVIEDDQPGDLQVSVALETSVDDLPSSDMDKPIIDEDDQAGWFHFGKKGYSLSKQLKSYFSDPKIEINEGLFVHVVSHLEKFETIDSRSDLEKGLKYLKLRVNQPNFKNEALLHLIIAFRILKNETVYERSGYVHTYIRSFISKFEALSGDASFPGIIKDFLKSDFDIVGADQKPTTVFSELSKAALGLCRTSKAVDPQINGRRLIWVFIHLLFGMDVSDSESFTGLWRKIIDAREYFGEGKLGPDDFQDIQRTIKFGYFFDIPEELQFSGDNLAHLLIANGKIYQLPILRLILNIFKETLFQFHRNLYAFLMSYVSAVDDYITPRKEELTYLSPGGDLGTVLEEAMEFIVTAANCFKESAPEPELVVQPLSLFWKSLLLLVIEKNPKLTAKVLNQLSNALRAPSGSLKSQVRIALKEKFLELLREQLDSFTIDQFLEYYKSIPNIPPELVEEYLKSIKASRHTWMRIGSSPIFAGLLAEFFKIWPRCSSRYHKCFIELFKTFCESGRPQHTVVSDLLKLTDQHLLSTEFVREQETVDIMELQRDFKQFLKNLIYKNRLKDPVTNDFMSFLNSKKGTVILSPIQTVVLSVFAEFCYIGSVAELTDKAQSPGTRSVRFVISKLEQYYKDQAIWNSPVPVPLNWYWEILDRTCKLVNPHQPDLSLCADTVPIIQVISVYSAFVKCFKLIGPLEEVPDCVQGSANPHMKSYFKWIVDLQNLNTIWQNRILMGDCALQEIQCFCTYQVPIGNFFKHLQIESFHLTLEIATEKMTLINRLKEATKEMLVFTHKDGRKCSLMAVLKRYNLSIPTNLFDHLQESITKCSERLFANHVYSSEDETVEDIFNPDLKVKSFVTFHLILSDFLTPLTHYLEFIVHFVMNESQLIDQHLRERIKAHTSSASQQPQSGTEGHFPDAVDVPNSCAVSELPVEIFVKALQETQSHFQCIFEGTEFFREKKTQHQPQSLQDISDSGGVHYFLHSSSAALQESNQQIEKIGSELKDVQDKITEENVQMKASLTQIQHDARAELEMVRDECHHLKEKNTAVEVSLSQLQQNTLSELRDAKSDLGELRNEYIETLNDLQLNTGAKLRKLESDYESENVGIKSSMSQLQQQNETLQISLSEAKEEVNQLRVSLDQSKEENQSLNTLVASLGRDVQKLIDNKNEIEGQWRERFDQIDQRLKELEPSWKIESSQLNITDEEVGKGAYGEVKVGLYCGSQVAVKQLHEVIISPYFSKQFNREMKLASRLRHPQLVLFIGAVTTGTLTIVTELMETNLRKQLMQGRISEEHILPIGRDVACALNYLHSLPEPIIHRDVSSANVLLNSKSGGGWMAKLGDLGSANFLAKLSTQAPGAVIYAAPESLDPALQGPSMDVYSFGVLLFEVCTGELPDPGQRKALRSRVPFGTNQVITVIAKDCTCSEAGYRPTMAAVLPRL